jgi:hypothetical protein
MNPLAAMAGAALWMQDLTSKPIDKFTMPTVEQRSRVSASCHQGTTLQESGKTAAPGRMRPQ